MYREGDKYRPKNFYRKFNKENKETEFKTEMIEKLCKEQIN